MKILIVKTSSLGDIIHTFPVVAYLKHRFPHALIDWVVEKPFAELVQAHPSIHRVLCVETKKWRRIFPLIKHLSEIRTLIAQLRQETYDVVFDLQGNAKSGLLTLAAKGIKKVGFGRKTVPEWPNLLATQVHINPEPGRNIREDYLAIVQAFFEDTHSEALSSPPLKIGEMEQMQVHQLMSRTNAAKTILVCPGSIWRNKQLSEQTLQDLLQLIYQRFNCHFLFLWGNAAEQVLANQLHQVFLEHSQIVEKLPLPALQNLMGKVNLVLSMDSLPLHLAGTTGTPTFSIFGASLGQKYNPLGTSNHYVQGICPYGQTFTKRCPALRKCPTGACIRDLSAESLFQAFCLHSQNYL
ncbi:MAG: hypothetical protein CK425_08610 [Parachlamydia sp.]|nr:MAG: hypothetical protein CK425_08610 [Parachlamydia sp.]